MARLLVLLRVLIVLGAFAGIAQTRLQFAGFDPQWSAWSFDQRTLVKFALTAISLTLL